jgi:photosystem II stability/assembly factor-like uncharacterized protein
MLLLAVAAAPLCACGPRHTAAEVQRLRAVEALSMVDTAHGWGVIETSAVSSALVTTADGWHTWTVTTSPVGTTQLGRLDSLDAVSTSTAWVCQTGPTRGAGPQQAIGDYQFQRFPPDRCFVTADGGSTWTAHDVAGTGGSVSKRDRITESVVSIAGKDARHALAVIRGERGHTGGGQESDVLTDLRLLRTTDGGATWSTLRQRQPQPNEPPSPLSAPRLRVSGSHAWLLDFTPGVLERTDDGGDIWTTMPLPSVAGTYAGGITSPDRAIVAVPLISSRPATIRIASTTFAGAATWQLSPPHDCAQLCTEADGVDAADWVVSDMAGLSVTHDGGRTWARGTVNGSATTPGQIDMVTPRVGWAIGDSGASSIGENILVMTDDGGMTWSAL